MDVVSGDWMIQSFQNNMPTAVFLRSLMAGDALFLFPQNKGPAFVGLSDILPHILLP